MHWTSSPQCPFCNTNAHTCAHFCYRMVQCVIWNWSIARFVQRVYCRSSSVRMWAYLLMARFMPCIYIRADSGVAPTQWETALLCNDVSNWLGATLESALHIVPALIYTCAYVIWSLCTAYRSALLFIKDIFIRSKCNACNTSHLLAHFMRTKPINCQCNDGTDVPNRHSSSKHWYNV